MLHDLICKNRSYRRFHQNVQIKREQLLELVDLARLSPSAGNLQPLKFILPSDEETNARIFPHLRWAAYLKEWTGPKEGERPSAYLVILGDTYISPAIGPDHGIAAQSILLGATEAGFGGCIIASIDRTGLKEALAIPDGLEILMVVALGEPAEAVQIETVRTGGDIRYWRDESGVHHVPKRELKELILE
jgi:nitroreductase